MDERVKQRLVGAVVLVVAAVVFVPMLLDSGDGDPQPPARLIAEPRPVSSPPPLPEPAPAARKPPAKPVKQIAAAAPPVTRVKSGFAVQVGSFTKTSNARGLRDKLVAKGYTAYVKGSGSVTRVYVGPQSSRAMSEKMLKKLLAELQLKGIVVQLPP